MRQNGSDRAVPDPTLYLFDGWNLLHAGGYRDPRELIDRLASFVGTSGARGIVVFDGSGPDERIGPLQIRFAEHADALLERLAAEHRGRELVCIVSSDSVIRGVSGQDVRTISSQRFLADADAASHSEDRPLRLGDRVDERTREKLERLRRGET
jgi:predicted RNA-binding protein with PIN domain